MVFHDENRSFKITNRVLSHYLFYFNRREKREKELEVGF
jgi:hypothetical protein